MKKVLLTLIILISSITSIAQTSFNWTFNDSIVTDIDANSYTELKIEQTNISGSDLDLSIEVVYNDIPATWDGMICIEGICLGTIPAVGGTGDMSTVPDGQNGYVRLTANPMGGSEQITLRVKVYDRNNPTDADTATWIINSINYAGVDDSKVANSISVFPNPCQTSFSINNNGNVDKVEIVDLTGRVLHTQLYNTGDIINIQHLPAAVYVVNVYSEGTLVSYEKLVKND